MSVTIELDEKCRRATAVVPAETRWSSFEETVLAQVNRNPTLADWNWIIDDQGPMDDVDVYGMIRIGEAFRRLTQAPSRQTHTVVVTTDPHFPTWARVIDHNYGKRKHHHSAPTKGAAATLLDQLDAVGENAVA